MLGKAGRHVVERHRQPPDFIPLIHRNPHGKVALGKGFGRLEHLLQRTNQIVADKINQYKGHNHHHQRTEQEHLQDFSHKVGQTLCGARSKDHAGNPAVGQSQRNPHRIVGAFVDFSHLAHFAEGFVLNDLVDNLRRNTVNLVAAICPVGTQQNFTRQVGKIDVCVHRLGHRHPGVGQRGLVVHNLIQAVHRNDVVLNQLCRILGILFQTSEFVLFKILRRKHHEQRSQHGDACQHDGAANRKIFPKQTALHILNPPQFFGTKKPLYAIHSGLKQAIPSLQIYIRRPKPSSDSTCRIHLPAFRAGA